MSYDLMVFEAAAAPRDHTAFLRWYEQQTTWSEPHSYSDPAVSSLRLRKWFAAITQTFPPLDHDHAGSRATDYSIGRSVIYAAFAWSQAELAYREVTRLAAVHHVGFFDVSGNSQIVFPD